MNQHTSLTFGYVIRNLGRDYSRLRDRVMT
jgi:hypothetical protein